MRSLQSILRDKLIERFEQVGYTYKKSMSLSELVQVSKKNNSSAPYRELGILTMLAAEEFDNQKK